MSINESLCPVIETESQSEVRENACPIIKPITRDEIKRATRYTPYNLNAHFFQIHQPEDFCSVLELKSDEHLELIRGNIYLPSNAKRCQRLIDKLTTLFCLLPNLEFCALYNTSNVADKEILMLVDIIRDTTGKSFAVTRAHGGTFSPNHFGVIISSAPQNAPPFYPAELYDKKQETIQIWPPFNG